MPIFFHTHYWYAVDMSDAEGIGGGQYIEKKELLVHVDCTSKLILDNVLFFFVLVSLHGD